MCLCVHACALGYLFAAGGRKVPLVSTRINKSRVQTSKVRLCVGASAASNANLLISVFDVFFFFFETCIKSGYR